jgi:hypothetical protein
MEIRKMTSKTYARLRLLLTAVFLSVISLAHAGVNPEKLEVVLSHPSSTRDADAGFIVITVTNKSDQTLFLPRPKTPLENPDGHLWNLIFHVNTDSGEQVNFIGRMINVWRRSVDMYYMRIEPGQRLSKTINIAVDYDLSKGGNFKVAYDQPYAEKVFMSEGEAVDDRTTKVRSNTLNIWVSASLATAAKTATLTPN